MVVASALVEPALQQHVLAHPHEADAFRGAVETHAAVAGASQQARLPDVQLQAIVVESEAGPRLLELDAVAELRAPRLGLHLAAQPSQMRERLPREGLVAEDEFGRLLHLLRVAHVLWGRLLAGRVGGTVRAIVGLVARALEAP